MLRFTIVRLHRDLHSCLDPFHEVFVRGIVVSTESRRGSMAERSASFSLPCFAFLLRARRPKRRRRSDRLASPTTCLPTTTWRSPSLLPRAAFSSFRHVHVFTTPHHAMYPNHSGVFSLRFVSRRVCIDRSFLVGTWRWRVHLRRKGGNRRRPPSHVRCVFASLRRGWWTDMATSVKNTFVPPKYVDETLQTCTCCRSEKMGS